MIDKKTKRRLDARAKVLKALAHPTRLFILEHLRDGECCVCEIAGIIDADLSTVSRHLSVLRNAGIIEDDKRKNQVFYTLKVPCVLNFMGCVEAVLDSEHSE